MRILIVDDSRAMRMLVKRALRQAGIDSDVDEASNGKEALEAILKSKPGLVLCDWNMPEMTGIELLEQLRDQGVTLNFGFVTSEGTGAMRERASSAGAKFLLAKPFTPEALGDAVRPIVDAEK